ncbi:MAG: polysaccharide deacetylase family protein [Ruminococcaceae bacterium]|nr:polysaccharide deacetylase family protein [Oscillospiraceae bacterium]
MLLMFGIVIAYCTVMLTAFGGFSNFKAVLAPKKELPIYCVQTEEKKASLTFDAAWGNEDTQQLIDILGKYNVKATFFVVGEWVDKFPESVKALHDAGHEIMNHSNNHKHMPQLSAEEIKKDIDECNSKIQKVTGVTPILFRPPYGDYSDRVITTLRDMKMYTIQWDVDSLDWMDKTADYIVNRVTTKVKNGSIVLFHNAAKNTPEALPRIIEKLQSDGYSLIKVSEIIYKDNYEIIHDGTQCKIS